MSQKALHLNVGAQLLAGRRAAALSQLGMAQQVGCSVPTVRLAESGSGILFNFATMASRVGLVLDGDGLPGGGSIGQSLCLLRQRRGISRRSLAGMTSVSLPTLASLEAGRDVRVSNLVTVARSLGVVLRLRSPSEPAAFYSSVSKTSIHQA